MKRWIDTFLRGFWWKLGAALALLVLSYAMPSAAHAQNMFNAQCRTPGSCTKTQASQECNAAIAHAAAGGASTSGVTCRDNGVDRFEMKSSTGSCPGFNDIPTCTFFYRYEENNCPTKPALPAGGFKNSRADGAACFQGCLYDATTFSAGFKDETTGQWTYVGGSWSPTGDTCTADDQKSSYDPEKDVCTKQGTLTQCIKPDGKFCATASNGNRVCWNPGETGERQTADGQLKADRQVAPNMPAIEAADGSTITTSTTTIGDTIYNSSVSSGGVSSGPGQSNTGEGGSDGGEGGDGEGDGTCDARKEDCSNAGDAGSGVGNLYEKSGETIGGKFQQFRNRVSGSALASAGDQFFNVQSLGGSCPALTVPGTYYWEAMSFEYHCSGVLAAALASAGWLLLAIAAYAAFKVAFG